MQASYWSKLPDSDWMRKKALLQTGLLSSNKEMDPLHDLHNVKQTRGGVGSGGGDGGALYVTMHH